MMYTIVMMLALGPSGGLGIEDVGMYDNADRCQKVADELQSKMEAAGVAEVVTVCIPTDEQKEA